MNKSLLEKKDLPDLLLTIAAKTKHQPSHMRITQTLLFLCGLYGAKIAVNGSMRTNTVHLYPLHATVTDIKIHDSFVDETLSTLELATKYENNIMIQPSTNEKILEIKSFIDDVIDQLDNLGDFTLVEMMHTLTAWETAYTKKNKIDLLLLYLDCLQFIN